MLDLITLNKNWHSVTFLLVTQRAKMHWNPSWPVRLFAGWLHTIGSSFATRSWSSSFTPARKWHQGKSASSRSSHRCPKRWHESCCPAAAEWQQRRRGIKGEAPGKQPVLQPSRVRHPNLRMLGLPFGKLMPTFHFTGKDNNVSPSQPIEACPS